nr:ATP-binding protein [Gemmatimonadaceae bacterium]
MMRQRWQRSLPTRLFSAVFALGLVLVAMTAIIAYRSADRALRDRLFEQLQTAATDDATRITAWLARQRAAAELLARALQIGTPATGTLDDTRPMPTLPREVLADQSMQLIAVPGGRIVRASDSLDLGQYALDQLYYREGQRGTFTQGIYPDGTEGRPRLTVATPVRSAEGSLSAVLAVHVDLAELERSLARTGTRLPVDAFLVNRFAEFVSAERFGRDGLRRGVNTLAVREAIAGRNGFAQYTDAQGREVFGAWHTIPELGLAVVREVPRDAALGPARTLLIGSMTRGIIAVALLALGVLLITRRFTAPVLAVADAATRVAGGDFSVLAPQRGDDEVGQLAGAFNVMTARLRTLYQELEAQVVATRTALDEADANRALLQDVVNNTATLMLVVSLEGRVRLANARLAQLVGRPPADCAGLALETLLGDVAAPLGHAIGAARMTGTLVEQEVTLGDGDDAHAWQVVAFPLVRPEGEPYAIGLVATDLTERARAESERRVRDASVQQAQKLESLGVMAGGIAHDFNNLLSAILGHVELAREALTDARPDEVRASLEQVGTAGRRAADLTRQMLAYAGRASLKRDVVDVRTIIDDLVPLVRAAQSKKVHFAIEPMPEPLWVELDPAQLAQVLLNLLTNAAEAIGDANGVVTVHATSVARDGGTCVCVTVSDTGPGIPEHVRARIFDPFFTTKGSGRGLGLSAVRGIVQSLDGTLEVTSSAQGTQFIIALHAASPPTAPRVPRHDGFTTVVRGTVLVVDDEPSVRSVARRVLERMSLTVLEADDGEQAIALFAARQHELGLVLLDLTMPRLGGEEVLARIRATHPLLPVIVASGYDHADAATR